MAFACSSVAPTSGIRVPGSIPWGSRIQCTIAVSVFGIHHRLYALNAFKPEFPGLHRATLLLLGRADQRVHAGGDGVPLVEAQEWLDARPEGRLVVGKGLRTGSSKASCVVRERHDRRIV